MIFGLIVAAGKGERMKQTQRKQYIRVGNCSIVGHTLAAFDACDLIDTIYLIVPEEDLGYCRNQILPPLMLQKTVICVPGGGERQISVYNGLKSMGGKPDDIVVIHDGVRPFVRPSHIAASIEGAKKWGACLLGIPVSDTLKRVDPSGFIIGTVERAAVWVAQTPQAFRYGSILKAHEEAEIKGLTATDDASLLELTGKSVRMVSGSRLNIKITTREDLIFATALLSCQSSSARL